MCSSTYCTYAHPYVLYNRNQRDEEIYALSLSGYWYLAYTDVIHSTALCATCPHSVLSMASHPHIVQIEIAVQCSAVQCRARHILYIITISPLNYSSGSVYRHNKEKKGQTRAEATLRLSHRSTKIMAFSSRMVLHRRGIFPMASTSVDQDRAEQNRTVANNLSLPLAL